MINPGMFSSNTDLWPTPQRFFDQLDTEFRFTLDPCATAENRKCKNFFTAEEDGLKQEWNGKVFMNPPYGRAIKEWVRKAYEEAISGRAEVVVCLLPARTDTAWWHEFVIKGEVRFIRGRLKFGDGTNSAPFPSAVAIFRREQLQKN